MCVISQGRVTKIFQVPIIVNIINPSITVSLLAHNKGIYFLTFLQFGHDWFLRMQNEQKVVCVTSRWKHVSAGVLLSQLCHCV